MSISSQWVREELFSLPLLAPYSQADTLLLATREARRVCLTMAKGTTCPQKLSVADAMESALNKAIGANRPTESQAAQVQLTSALDQARRLGLRLSATLSALELSGRRSDTLNAVLS